MTAVSDPGSTFSASRTMLPIPDTATVLRRAVLYETHRLRATPSTRVLLLLVAGLGVLHGFNYLWEPTARQPGGGVSTTFVIDTIQLFAVSVQLPLVGLFSFGFGSSAITTEYRHRLARTTFLTLPTRGIAYLAKLFVPAAATVAAASVAALLAIATIVTLSGGHFLANPSDLATWTFWQPCLNYLIVIACWPMLAVGAAALTNSRVLTALFLTLWPLMGERIAGALLSLIPPLEGVHNWLPFAAARAAMTPTTVTDSISGSNLSPGAGITIFVTFTVLITAAGALTYTRKDAP